MCYTQHTFRFSIRLLLRYPSRPLPISKKTLFEQGCINRARIGEDLSSESSLPSFPHLGNVGITRKIMESTAELIFCGS